MPGCLLEILKKTPRRFEDPVLWVWLGMFFTPKIHQFQNNKLSPVIFFFWGGGLGVGRRFDVRLVLAHIWPSGLSLSFDSTVALIFTSVTNLLLYR